MSKRIELGARVWAKDGKLGKVTKIVVDPETHEPEYLVVKQGWFRPRRVVLPVSLVTDASSGEVTVATTADALESFPDYDRGMHDKPGHVRAPESLSAYTRSYQEGDMVRQQPGSPQNRVRIGRDMEVLDATGLRLGQVYELFLGGSEQQISHIGMRHLDESIPLKYRLVPVDLVADVQDDEVLLRIPAHFVYGLSAYWPSTRLHTKVSIEQGATVIASGGERVGQIDGLVLDSEGQAVSSLILSRQRQPPRRRKLSIPVAQVATVRGGEVYLQITADELRNLDVCEE